MNEILTAFGDPMRVFRNGVLFIDGNDLTAVPVSIMIQQYWITMNPEDFLLDVSALSDGSVLQVLILPNTLDFFILGAPIFQGYYMSFEHRKTLGIVPHSTSSKSSLRLG
jgi:hypothetical protein